MRSTIKMGPRTMGLRRARRRDAISAQISQAAGYAAQIQQQSTERIEANFAAMARASIVGMNPLARNDPPEAPDAGVAQLYAPKKPTPPGLSRTCGTNRQPVANGFRPQNSQTTSGSPRYHPTWQRR